MELGRRCKLAGKMASVRLCRVGSPGGERHHATRNRQGLVLGIADFVGRPDGDRPLKGGFAAACGGALRAPLTARSPPGLGSASDLSLARRVAPAA